MVRVEALDVRSYLGNPCAHDGRTGDAESVFIAIVAVGFIRKLPCKDGRVVAVGHSGDGVDARDNLAYVVLVRLIRHGSAHACCSDWGAHHVCSTESLEQVYEKGAPIY